MRYYDTQGWFSLVCRRHATFWGGTWRVILAVFFFSLAAYVIEAKCDAVLAESGHTIFGSAMSYLLVFRSHTAFMRYWDSREYLTRLFHCMREYVMASCVCMRGGAAIGAWRESRMPPHERAKLEDGNDVRASIGRVNLVRWTIALGVSMRIHVRLCNSGLDGVSQSIDEDHRRQLNLERIRLRGLVTRQEFEAINQLVPTWDDWHVTRGSTRLTDDLVADAVDATGGSLVDQSPDMRQPAAILFKMGLELVSHMSMPWGIRERFAADIWTMYIEASRIYGMIDNTIRTPTPFPYVHLCKLLLACFIFSTPLVIDYRLGFFANVLVPSAVAVGLVGIDAICSELENPFGEDANDLDFKAIAALEDECMTILELCGDIRARAAFEYYEVPERFRTEDEVTDGVTDGDRFLCIRSQLPVEETVSTPASRQSALSTRKRAKDAKKLKLREDADESDEVRQPLLDGSTRASPHLSSMRMSLQSFVPMEEFGTETIHFAEQRQGGGGLDNVGLSDSESDTEKVVEKKPAKFPRHGRDDAARDTIALSSSYVGDFVPLPEFGTQTIHLEEAMDHHLGADDVVGLSDDESAEGDEVPKSGKGSPSHIVTARSAQKAKTPSKERSENETGRMMSKSSNVGFMPLPNLTSQTIILDDDSAGSRDVDVVGLSDEEEEGLSPVGRAASSSRAGVSSSRGAFRPMPEMGSQTINLEVDAAEAGGDVIDVIGLDDLAEGSEEQSTQRMNRPSATSSARPH